VRLAKRGAMNRKKKVVRGERKIFSTASGEETGKTMKKKRARHLNTMARSKVDREKRHKTFSLGVDLRGTKKKGKRKKIQGSAR